MPFDGQCVQFQLAATQNANEPRFLAPQRAKLYSVLTLLSDLFANWMGRSWLTLDSPPLVDPHSKVSKEVEMEELSVASSKRGTGAVKTWDKYVITRSLNSNSNWNNQKKNRKVFVGRRLACQQSTCEGNDGNTIISQWMLSLHHFTENKIAVSFASSLKALPEV